MSAENAQISTIFIEVCEDKLLPGPASLTCRVAQNTSIQNSGRKNENCYHFSSIPGATQACHLNLYTSLLMASKTIARFQGIISVHSTRAHHVRLQ